VQRRTTLIGSCLRWQKLSNRPEFASRANCASKAASQPCSGAGSRSSGIRLARRNHPCATASSPRKSRWSFSEPDRHPCRCPPFPSVLIQAIGVLTCLYRRRPVLKPPAGPRRAHPRLGRIRASQRLLEAGSSLDPSAAGQSVTAALNQIARRRLRGHAHIFASRSTPRFQALAVVMAASSSRRQRPPQPRRDRQEPGPLVLGHEVSPQSVGCGRRA
jgi:hypothetical protein